MNWLSASLGRLARAIGGGTPSKQNSAFWNGTIPWVSPKDMGGRDVSDAEDHITEAAVAGSATQVVPVGSVLVVVRSGILVRRFPIAIARVPVALNQDMKALLPGGALIPEFLAYALEAQASYVLSECVKRGATVHSVDMGKFSQMQVPVPAPSEQNRIVELLAQADALRSLRAETNAKADRIIPALFQKTFGDPATNTNGWQTETLGELAVELRYGTSQRCDDNSTGATVLRIPNVVRGEVDWTDLKYSSFPEDEMRRLRLELGDILFVRTNGNPEYVGRCAVFEPSVREALFASYLIRVRVESTRIDPWFLAAFVRTPSGRRAMKPYIRTTAGQSNIGAEGLRSIAVPVPPMALQMKFREAVMAVRQQRVQCLRSSMELESLFAIMLTRAFSGALTSSWRKSHMKELLQEMEQQARYLAASPSPEARA